MWLAEVKAKAKRQNQILFSKDNLLLLELSQLVQQTNRRALVLWALELAEETALELVEKHQTFDPESPWKLLSAWPKVKLKCLLPREQS